MMTTQELEKIIESQAETQNLDFKDDCPWDSQKMAKDILAMTNMRDGGTIIIGVAESIRGFEKKGVNESNLSSYDIDKMRDQLARFADPAVNIQVSYPNDTDGRKYVAIKVSPFKDIPVISRISIEKVIQANAIYYRNSNKRIESAPVSNSHDLRDILESAALKIMQRRQEFGYRVEPALEEILDNELESFPGDGLLNTIRLKGYWEVRLQPLQKSQTELLSKSMSTIKMSQVSKAWHYPFISTRDDQGQGRINGGEYSGEYCNLGCRKELWITTKSGQFLLFSALPEDWYENDPFYAELATRIPPEKFVTQFTSIIYFITGIVEFAGRLATHGFFDNGIRIKMTLNHTKNRKLLTDSDEYRPLMHNKTTHSPSLNLKGQYGKEEIIQKSLEISNLFIRQIFEGFGYSPLPEIVKAAQKKFLSDD